ncbi:MAG: hypothetical protein KJ077_05990 [Anaerolineae bacterium]|nr:hypothetical protein [Anaerolineae bacterium]
MENLWPDLQETFFLLLGPYIAALLLPVFIGSGLVLAILMSFSRFWRPKEVIEVKMNREE